ncbi:PREDICTED: uncharacterized protein LOC106329743 [Brassica oleracea var. oleracea]|uniref:Uncharacterized protein n=1 Tax=Brassica oleracea var. oleracea TaxID=109376 RepID=A0A0D3B2R7_BRAOL|nr:PREDICTED: uncharacterized protein LOC106329743 [Brassica oleracea var. oleracea]
MGIDVKETGATIWKVFRFSMNTSIKFMRNHPVSSGVFMFLLALYVILPSLFFFLIYSSPVLACGVVYAREKMGLSIPSSGSKSCGGEKDGVRCHLRQQRSVRRNARMQVEEWDSQTSEEEKDKVILTSLYNDLLGRKPHFEESPKAIETEVVEDNEKSVGEEDSQMSYVNVEEPMVCNRVKEEKEEMREEMSNSNEHGVSEIDRDRRLESLIARRRTKRLFKLALHQHNKHQAEETARSTHNNNLRVNIPGKNNNNPFEKRRNYYPSDDDSTVMGLQFPSSAPSVMLQARNPFDIPYDPQEERPILSGDSFDQEFSFLDHKDMFLSRHESFSRFDLFSPEHAQCINRPASTSDITTTKKRLDLENEYEQNTIEDDNKCVESGKLEVNNETDSNNEDDDDDSSCSEESESEHNRFNKAELREAISHTMDNYPSFLVNQARNNIPSPLPRGLAPPKIDDNNMFYARRREHSHSRTFSMASDMQVEVSEIGSPPTMVDWLDEWSNDGESYIYDTDIDREVIRGEESCKSVSSQCESKEDNSWLETKPVAEHLRMTDDMYTRSQAEENFDQKFSSLSDVSKPTRGLLFHTSVSLSSITEEPETIFDSVDGGTSENMNILTTNLADQISPDSSRKKFLDEEVIDVQPLENNDLCGSPKIVASNIIDHQQKDQILNSIQGEYDTNQIHMKNENTKPKEYEATQSLLDASLDIPYIESFEREINEKEEEDEQELDNFTKVVTIQTEDKALQDDLKSSPSHVLTKLLESEATVENGLELGKSTDAYAKPIELEKRHDVLEASSSHSSQLLEDYGNAENGSDLFLLQVQDSYNSALDESTEHPLSNEVESSRLSKDLCGESAQEFNNITNVEEDSTVSEGTHNSQGSQPWTQQHGTDSSEGISATTLEITQQPEHSDAIYSNTVSQDTTDEDIFAKDSTATEKNDEEKLKPDEQVIEQAVEKELELDLQSMHHNTGLVSKEDDEESKKVNGAVHKAETTTAKTETET